MSSKRNGSKFVGWAGRTAAGSGGLLLLFVALLLALLSAGQTAVVTAKAQPALVALAAESPDQMVRIIAQTGATPEMVAARVALSGGRMVRELRLINAFVAEMPADAAVQLAAEPAVRWVSLDGAVENAGNGNGNSSGGSRPVNQYLDTIRARDAWALGYDGQGIGVAVIDSGIGHSDLEAQIVVEEAFNIDSNKDDNTGHGTHVAGIIGGDGGVSDGDYAGVAPGVTLLALNVSDNSGMAYESDVVAAMQWVYDNRDAHNIRVVNLSINSTVPSSYHTSPMNAAAEILWFNGIVVVVSAGNNGTGAQIDTITAAPANDPFLITVGATDENGTDRKQDDDIPDFSASGRTLDDYWKPDIFAPGVDIVSTLPSYSRWKHDYPERTINIRHRGTDYKYFRATGTSMSAPMVTGAVALLLQAEPDLTPDEVKGRLMTASTTINGYAYLDIYKALTTSPNHVANTGLEASQLLWTGSTPITWDSVSWNSVAWNSVAWNSVAWNSVAWNSVAWNSTFWGE